MGLLVLEPSWDSLWFICNGRLFLTFFCCFFVLFMSCESESEAVYIEMLNAILP